MEEPTDSRAAGSESSPDGPAWAALLAAGIGGAVFGLITDISECAPRASKLLQWYRPAGALSGVGISAVVIWVAVWVVLHARWKGKTLQHNRMLMASTILLALIAIVTTFPPFYELFGG